MKTHKNSGQLVAQLRKTIGKSQSQFAVLVGVSKYAIIAVENGRNKLSKSLARRIQIATGAKILDENIRFEPVSYLPVAESPGKLTPEAAKFLRSRWDGTGKFDDLYTRKDFEQWRANFFPSSDETARKSFDKIKQWVEFIFKAAAKPGVAGNRDRLPAVYQSLVEWLNETRENLKLEKEVDDILEQETHGIGEAAYSISYLKKPDDPERVREEFAAYGYDFNEVKKHFKKAKPNDWIVLQTECRNLWEPFRGAEFIPCKTRTLLTKPKFHFENGWDYAGRTMHISKEDTLRELAEFQAKNARAKMTAADEPVTGPKP